MQDLAFTNKKKHVCKYIYHFKLLHLSTNPIILWAYLIPCRDQRNSWKSQSPPPVKLHRMQPQSSRFIRRPRPSQVFRAVTNVYQDNANPCNENKFVDVLTLEDDSDVWMSVADDSRSATPSSIDYGNDYCQFRKRLGSISQPPRQLWRKRAPSTPAAFMTYKPPKQQPKNRSVDMNPLPLRNTRVRFSEYVDCADEDGHKTKRLLSWVLEQQQQVLQQKEK